MDFAPIMTNVNSHMVPLRTAQLCPNLSGCAVSMPANVLSLTKGDDTLNIDEHDGFQQTDLKHRPLMIESISIQNFRGFENVQLSNLKRINVIVGQNSSGKTALLESIFLAGGGSPEIALRMNAQRGLGLPFQVTWDRTSYESLWKYHFFGFDQERQISIDLKGSDANTRSVRVSYGDPGSVVLPFPKSGDSNSGGDSPFIVPITFEWRDYRGELFRAQPLATREGINVGGVGETIPIAFFASTAGTNPAENATRFSELDLKGRADVLVRALSEEFPSIEGVSIQIVSGTPILHATLKQSSLKMPLGLLSGGISKYVALLLAIAGKSQGVVLVDEIENEFYFDRMPGIWSRLLEMCRRENVQMFVSTHSQECLDAALATVRGNESDFALIRTDRLPARGNSAVVFSGRQFESAIQQNVEVR